MLLRSTAMSPPSAANVHDERRFSWKLVLIPAIVGVIVALINFQWMRKFQLVNAPTADSLVYLTEAYRDYWIFHDQGFGTLLSKYVSVGNQQTSPLLWWVAMVSFMLFGLDPINAYLFIALAYVGWIAGVVHLAWQVRPDSNYAIASGLLAAALPSAVSHGLRDFMTDFSAALPFVWATAILLRSDFLASRRDAVLYGLLCGIAILFRTTVLPYFLVHALILVVLAKLHKRRIDPLNAGIAALVAIVVAGWFVFPNRGRIFQYYSYWSNVASAAGGSSFIDNLWFYLKLLPVYHLSIWLFLVTAAWTALALAIIVVRRRSGDAGTLPPSGLRDSLIVALLLGFAPMLLLSFYGSRAASVDFPYIAAFALIPPLLWREAAPRRDRFWMAMGVLLAAFFIQQSLYLFRAPAGTDGPQDFREREAVAMILEDAQNQRLRRVTLGNTAIHRHNALSYEYWVLRNEFPRWRGRVDTLPRGWTDSPEELAKLNARADYVITLENQAPDAIPNNRAAPAANRLLEERYKMKPLAATLALPDGTTLKILAP